VRLEDLYFAEGWEWRGDFRRYELSPGDSEVVIRHRGRGFFYGAIAAFTGNDDARYGAMVIDVDGTFVMPLYPYGLNAMGIDQWTPYGLMLLKFDSVSDIYAVAEIPSYLIPIRHRLEIKLVYPRSVTTIWGNHINKKDIVVYIAYLYIHVYDEGAFKRSLAEVYGAVTR